MFTTVVWATDGSENAARALPYATALAKGEGALLVTVHIVQDSSTASEPRTPAADSDPHDATAAVRKLVGELSRGGLNAILKVVDFVGPQPAQGIADVAQEVDADVIVVGTPRHSRLGGLLVGSVTQQLLHIAPCPVLAVPPVSHVNLKGLSSSQHTSDRERQPATP
jgi:nucleotide-binding universal stress UspA family protein